MLGVLFGIAPSARSSSASSLCWPCGSAPRPARGSTSARSSTTAPTGGPSSGACPRDRDEDPLEADEPDDGTPDAGGGAAGARQPRAVRGRRDQRGDQPVRRVIGGLERRARSRARAAPRS